MLDLLHHADDPVLVNGGKMEDEEEEAVQGLAAHKFKVCAVKKRTQPL
jgi:hypothetical protein